MSSGMHRSTPACLTAGYSLIELLVVCSLIAIGAMVAIPVSRQFITVAKADSASVSTLTAIEAAHDYAVAQRRNIEMTFVAPDLIRLERQEVPGPQKTLIGEYSLQNGQKFHKFTGVPDTPDVFGGATAITFSGTEPVMFTSDGSLVDSNGDIVNGTIFLGSPDDITTARAITIWGVTGLTKTWKWRGGSWME